MRRTGALVLATAVAVGTMAIPVSGAAKTESVPSGKARAQVGLIGAYPNPTFALEFGISVSQADIEDKVGRASSAYIDFGLATLLGAAIGELPTLKKLGIKTDGLPQLRLPEPAAADARSQRDIDRVPVLPHFVPSVGNPLDDPAPDQVKRFVAGLPTAYDSKVQTGRETVHASEGVGRSKTILGTLNLADFFIFGPGYTETKVDQREAMSVTSLDRLQIGPFITFYNLVWRSRQVMGKPAEGSFTFGSIKILAKEYRPSSLGDLAKSAAGINERLGPWGVEIAVPSVEANASGSKVGPLVFQFRDGERLEKILGVPYQRLFAPSVNNLFTKGQEKLPEAGLLFLVANVVVGAATGYGGIRLEVGGTSADLAMKDVEVFVPPDPVKGTSTTIGMIDGGEVKQKIIGTSAGSDAVWIWFVGLAALLVGVGIVDHRRVKAATERGEA